MLNDYATQHTAQNSQTDTVYWQVIGQQSRTNTTTFYITHRKSVLMASWCYVNKPG